MKLEMVSSSSAKVEMGPQVFINFRGVELRKTFVSHLHDSLKRMGITAFIDSDEPAGENLDILFKRIEQSTVALAILSSRYTESRWCLRELVKIMECVERESLWVIPIFYQLNPSTVKSLDGDFGVRLWDLWRKSGRRRDDRILQQWDAALQGVAGRFGLESEKSSDDVAFLNKIITHVQDALTKDVLLKEKTSKPQGRGGENPKPKPEEGGSNLATSVRFKQLEEKLDVDCIDNETRVVGIVGMAGIGKTYLAEKLLVKLNKKITRHVFIEFEREKRKEQGSDWLQKRLVEGLLKQESPVVSGEDAFGSCKSILSQKKIAVILDNVIEKNQIEEVLSSGNCDWIKKGSRIVITTRDESLLKGLDCHLYEVPELNDKEGLELFKAQIGDNLLEGSFMEMSRNFLDYAGGNPFAIKAFGEELREKDEGYWEARLGTLTQVPNGEIGNILRICFDELNQKQKDTFLDIAYFFRSKEEKYVTSLLDSSNHEEVRDLADKFLIHISNGQVEIQDLLFTVVKEISETRGSKHWIVPSSFVESTDALKNKEGRKEVRGIVLDMSTMGEKPLDNQTFVGMSSLRYLKVYSSIDDGHIEPDHKLNLPDGLEFPEDNILRYIYWINFPGKELPSNFKPDNLMDLRLPYSKITRVWQGTKFAPKLRWVDLSHSSELTSLSGLSNAQNLLRLNLEGCTSLEELPEEMKEMKSLVFLNLRECTSLSSLPDINMDSLKVLILSGCSKLHKFQVISEKIETLYLNGTAINELPSTIGNLRLLILLDLKDCKNLVRLPDCLWKLTSLQELKLSRCLKLDCLPDVEEEHTVGLRILQLDGTSITEMPHTISSSSFSSLQRLCLSRNDKVRNLQLDTSHLKWLELKYCKSLTSLKLPPNLQCLDAHGCISLRTVTTSLDLVVPSTENVHSTLIFTNCNELEQASKNAIISYVQKKGQLISNDRDSVFGSLIGVCFPGYQVPIWFNHKAIGSLLKLKLHRGWNKSMLNGVALCVVVSFKEFKDKTNTLQIKCTCEFTGHADLKLKRVSFIIGGWSEPGDDEPKKIESDHVFIGYTSWFNNNDKLQQEGLEKEYVPTEISLRFQVTNGTSEFADCEVMKCGFSLLNESDGSVSWEPSLDVAPRSEDSAHGETVSYVVSEKDVHESNGVRNRE